MSDLKNNLEFDLDEICKNWGTFEVRGLVLKLVNDAIKAYRNYESENYDGGDMLWGNQQWGKYSHSIGTLEFIVDFDEYGQLINYILREALELK